MESLSSGYFISFEGPDGSGKSSVLKLLVEKLKQTGYDHLLLTREPGGYQNPIAEAIRRVILDANHDTLDARTEALLFAAARRQHVVETIVPHLQKGGVVISDRYVDSSLVYQGVARNLGVDVVWQINQFAIETVMPSLTLLIDVPADVGLQRIYQARGKRQFDRLDQEDIHFHNLVREAFLQLVDAYPERIKLVDGEKTIPEVVDVCYQIVVEHLNLR